MIPEVMILLQEAIVDAQSVRIRALEMEARTLQVPSPSDYRWHRCSCANSSYVPWHSF